MGDDASTLKLVLGYAQDILFIIVCSTLGMWWFYRNPPPRIPSWKTAILRVLWVAAIFLGNVNILMAGHLCRLGIDLCLSTQMLQYGFVDAAQIFFSAFIFCAVLAPWSSLFVRNSRSCSSTLLADIQKACARSTTTHLTRVIWEWTRRTDVCSDLKATLNSLLVNNSVIVDTLCSLGSIDFFLCAEVDDDDDLPWDVTRIDY